ncbi:MAG: aminotransferase class I/II-fold pyridoxal phosphate-dependent enzyme [Chloroflexota bacterium]
MSDFAKRVLAERVNAVPPSGIRRFFDIAAEMDDVISLGVGEPDFDTPSHIVEAAITALRAGRTHYTSNYGTSELRAAIATMLKERSGVSYDPATEIIVTIGASEAVDLAIRGTINPGDELILPEPSYVAYLPAVVFAGGVALPIPTRAADGWRLDPAEVERVAPKAKALFLGYPANPTGATLDEATRTELARIAVAHDLLVISDEIYDRLVYEGPAHRAISAYPGMKERTILIGGFSKSYAMTGWRIGFMCAPAPIIAGLVKIHQYAIMSAPTIAQDAALEALRNGEGPLEEMRLAYARRRQIVLDGLAALGLPTGAPKGAFYAFPDISSTGMSDEAFAEGLLMEEHVAVIPGSAFGASGRGHVRICYATSEEKLREALVRIGRFVEKARAAKDQA